MNPAIAYDYTFSHVGGDETTVTAHSEGEARRKAMIARWGAIPDNVCPHAPNYNGYGLYLISSTEAR